MKHARINPRRAASRRRVREGGFTLLELLTVIGIVVLLSTITLGGMRSLNGAGNRRSAISRLMGVLDQARMLAISENRATYVVFASPLPGQTSAPAQITPAMWGRAYAVFQDTNDFDRRTQRSAWMFLPTGVAFKSNSGDGETALTNQALDSQDKTTFPVSSMSQTTGAKDLALPYLKFDPTGSLVDYKGNTVEADSPTARLLLFDGFVDSSGNETMTNRGAANDTDYRKRRLAEVDIKPTTGRAKYVLDPLDNLAVAATPAP